MLEPFSGQLAGIDPDSLFAPVADHQRIGLAVSGGADSLALMVIAALWSRAPGRPRPTVYTLDHRLRPEAEDEARTVAGIAAELGLEAHILRWDEEKPRSGIQAAARRARYRLIGNAMASDGATVLLTGHHQSDQAETVLMRMAHGSGVSGLSGMRRFSEVEGVALYRPFLDIAPEMLVAVCEHAGLAPSTDPSNRDTAYERVRWRQMLAELAGMGLTPERLGQLAGRLGRIDDFAGGQMDRFWASHCRIDRLGIIHIERAAFDAAHREIGIRTLGHAIGLLAPDGRSELGLLETLHEVVVADEFAGRTLEGTQTVANASEILVFRELGRMARMPVPVQLGAVLVWDHRFIVRSEGEDLLVGCADGLSRREAESLIGEKLGVPMAAVGSAPLVTDRAGRILALGTYVVSPGAEIGHRALT